MMLKLGLLIATAGVLAVLLGGGLIVYSQTRSGAVGVVERALESLKTPVYQDVVARVNGSEIAGARVQFGVAIGVESQVPDLEEASFDERSVLNFYIDMELIYQEAERRGLLCTQDEVRLLIERQVTRIPEHADVWAAHLGVTADQVVTHPEIVSRYSRLCAGSALFVALAREEGFDNRTQEYRQFYGEFVQALRVGADIEILDPSLQ